VDAGHILNDWVILLEDSEDAGGAVAGDGRAISLRSLRVAEVLWEGKVEERWDG